MKKKVSLFLGTLFRKVFTVMLAVIIGIMPVSVLSVKEVQARTITSGVGNCTNVTYGGCDKKTDSWMDERPVYKNFTSTSSSSYVQFDGCVHHGDSIYNLRVDNISFSKNGGGFWKKNDSKFGVYRGPKDDTEDGYVKFRMRVVDGNGNGVNWTGKYGFEDLDDKEGFLFSTAFSDVVKNGNVSTCYVSSGGGVRNGNGPTAPFSGYAYYGTSECENTNNFTGIITIPAGGIDVCYFSSKHRASGLVGGTYNVTAYDLYVYPGSCDFGQYGGPVYGASYGGSTHVTQIAGYSASLGSFSGPTWTKKDWGNYYEEYGSSLTSLDGNPKSNFNSSCTTWTANSDSKLYAYWKPYKKDRYKTWRICFHDNINRIRYGNDDYDRYSGGKSSNKRITTTFNLSGLTSNGRTLGSSGYSGGSVDCSSVDGGQPISGINSVVPVRSDGALFVGWAWEGDGKGHDKNGGYDNLIKTGDTIPGTEDVLESLDTYTHNFKEGESSGWTMDLYAVWVEPGSYIVKFDNNDSTGSSRANGSLSPMILDYLPPVSNTSSSGSRYNPRENSLSEELIQIVNMRIPHYSYTRVGYDFKGWGFKKDVSYSDLDGDAISWSYKGYPRDSIGWNRFKTSTGAYIKNGGYINNLLISDYSSEYQIFKSESHTWDENDNGTVSVRQNGQKVNAVTLYAIWEPHTHTVTYHPNVEDGTVLTHEYPNPETVKFDELMHLSRYGYARTGWDFIGWNMQATASSGGLADTPLTVDDDITLYAISRRYLNLILTKDNVAGIDEKTFSKTIYSRSTEFNYNNRAFTNATTRSNKQYKIQFNNNGPSSIIGFGEYKVGDDVVSTDLNANNQIIATRIFDGWYNKDSSGYQSDLSGVRFGTSGTFINVIPKVRTANNYTVLGNENSLYARWRDREIRLYPEYKKSYVKLPNCTRDSRPNDADPNGSKPDLFLGWFTNPQPDDGGTGDGGIYYGKAGDVVEVKGDATLYPWFNIAPTIVHSVIGENMNGTTPEDVKKGFYEGQPISYAQMMSLINASDEDNPAEIGPEGLVTFNGPRVWSTLCRLNIVSFLHDTYPDMSVEDLDKYEQMTNYNTFVPKLVGIEYKRNGKDPNGFDVSDGVSRTQTINGDENAKLLTDQEYLGDIILHYQVTDNGTFANGVQIMTGRVAKPSGKVYAIDSPITVDFYLHTKINFNNLPRIVATSIPLYSVDKNITSSNITNILLSKQDATDHEDDNDYKPWWFKADTGTRLDNSLNIVRIYDIKFNNGYLLEHPDECKEVAKITDIKTLFKLKDENDITFQHITSFMVELDCVDQWGKHASGYYGKDHGIDGSYDETSKNPDGTVKPIGMLPIDRSFVVTMFNNYDDYDLVRANSVVAERLRYIDEYWMNNLGDNSYWGDFMYGKSKLQKVFENYNGVISSSYNGTLKNGTPITINDYTE